MPRLPKGRLGFFYYQDITVLRPIYPQICIRESRAAVPGVYRWAMTELGIDDRTMYTVVVRAGAAVSGFSLKR